MITTFSININLPSEVTIQQTYFYHFSMTKICYFLKNTDMILIDLRKVFDTINLKILLDKLLPIGFIIEYYQLVWTVFSRASLYCRCCKSGFKIHKYLLSCSTRFNFRSSTVFDLCQLYESRCRMRLVLTCRWFMVALTAQERHWNKKKQLTKDFSNICD